MSKNQLIKKLKNINNKKILLQRAFELDLNEEKYKHELLHLEKQISGLDILVFLESCKHLLEKEYSLMLVFKNYKDEDDYSLIVKDHNRDIRNELEFFHSPITKIVLVRGIMKDIFYAEQEYILDKPSEMRNDPFSIERTHLILDQHNFHLIHDQIHEALEKFKYPDPIIF